MVREHPRYQNMDWPEYEYREYPRIVYPGAPDPKKPYGPNGKRLKGIKVHDEDEERRVMKTPEAVELVEDTGSVQRVKTEEDERAALIEQANTLGVKVDGRWSPTRIREAIESAANQIV